MQSVAALDRRIIIRGPVYKSRYFLSLFLYMKISVRSVDKYCNNDTMMPLIFFSAMGFLKSKTNFI